jgi:hypothetical protein
LKIPTFKTSPPNFFTSVLFVICKFDVNLQPRAQLNKSIIIYIFCGCVNKYGPGMKLETSEMQENNSGLVESKIDYLFTFSPVIPGTRLTPPKTDALSDLCSAPAYEHTTPRGRSLYHPMGVSATIHHPLGICHAYHYPATS